LVVGEQWQVQQKRVTDYIRSQGYYVVDSEPTCEILRSNPRVAMVRRDDFSYEAVRTPMDLSIAKEVIAAVESARGKVVKWPTMGGSVPLGAMERAADNEAPGQPQKVAWMISLIWFTVGAMAAVVAVEIAASLFYCVPKAAYRVAINANSLGLVLLFIRAVAYRCVALLMLFAFIHRWALSQPYLF
jgi:hypothetical protein